MVQYTTLELTNQGQLSVTQKNLILGHLFFIDFRMFFLRRFQRFFEKFPYGSQDLRHNSSRLVKFEVPHCGGCV